MNPVIKLNEEEKVFEVELEGGKIIKIIPVGFMKYKEKLYAVLYNEQSLGLGDKEYTIYEVGEEVTTPVFDEEIYEVWEGELLKGIKNVLKGEDTGYDN